MTSRRLLVSQRGFSLLALLAALLVIGLLYLFYSGGSGRGGRHARQVEVTRQAGQATACAGDRRSLELAITTWSVSHPGQPATLAALRQAGVIVPKCPEGGTLRIEGRRVLCSRHSPHEGG